ncbi:MAG: 1-acyl-sn-glycerol-3-phosphate acyltransferase [Clostridia bacterium]|nr:1-acyl-sn-glycerol-3-phosphate acyltransferase [Clostridia bacterium]
MKIIQNIIPAIKLYGSLLWVEKYRRQAKRFKEQGNFEEERKALLASTSLWGKMTMRLFKVDLHVTGRENLPQRGPVVYVSNHQAYGDIMVYCAVLDTVQFGFVAKNVLEKVPLYGGWIKRIRSVFMDRDDARASLRAIEEGIDLIRNGFSLLIFPEGTRAKGGPMKEFKKGSLRLATKPGVPVIPLTIEGSWRLFEEKGTAQHHMRVDVTIHPPIETAGMSRHEAAELPEKVEEIVRGGMKKT